MSFSTTHVGFGPYGLSDEELTRILGTKEQIPREQMIERINSNSKLLRSTFTYPDLMIELYKTITRHPGDSNLLGTRASPQCGLNTGGFVPLTSIICSYMANGLESVLNLSQCNQLSLRLAEGMIRSASISDRPHRPFQEVVINAINGYRKVRGVNILPESGYGFFTLLPLINQGKLVVNSCNRVSHDTECHWELYIIDTEEGYKAKIYSSMEPYQDRDHTQVSIMLPDMSISYMEEIKDVIRRTFSYVPERIMLNNQVINEGFAIEDGGLIEIVIDNKIMIIKDSSTGISLSTLFNNLLIPFNSPDTKDPKGTIDLPAEARILENRESLVTLDIVHNDLVISRHQVSVDSGFTTYYLRLPSSLKVSAHRDYIHYRSEEDILLLMDPLTKLFTSALTRNKDIVVLYNLFKEYIYSTNSKYLIGAFYQIQHRFSPSDKIFPVPKEHYRLYTHIKDVFKLGIYLIPSDYPQYTKISNLIKGLPNKWSGKDHFVNKFSILVPGMFQVTGKKVTDGGIMDIYFIDSSLESEVTLPSFVTKSMGVEVQISSNFNTFKERIAKFAIKYPVIESVDGFYRNRVSVMEAHNLNVYEMSNYWYHLLDTLERLNIKKENIRVYNESQIVDTNRNLAVIQGYIGHYFDTFTKLKLRAFELSGNYTIEDPLSFAIFNKVDPQLDHILTLYHPVYILLISYHFRSVNEVSDMYVIKNILKRIIYSYDIDTISYQLVEYMSKDYEHTPLDIIFNEIDLYLDIYNKFYVPSFHVHNLNLTFHQMNSSAILLTANQLIYYVSRNNVDMNNLSWLYQVGSTQLPNPMTFRGVEYAVSRNSNHYGVAFINETVKNTILNFNPKAPKVECVNYRGEVSGSNPIDLPGCPDRYDFQIGKYTKDYAISARDYVGFNGENLISLLIPFLSSKRGFGIGLMTIFRSPYAKAVYISTRDPNSGHFYEVIAIPIVIEEAVVDIKYQIRVSQNPYPENTRMTEITATFNDMGKEQLVELMSDSLIHSNSVLPYMSHKVKCTINNQPVLGDTISLFKMDSHLGGNISVRVSTSEDFIPSILMVNGKIKGKLLSFYNPKEDWVLSAVSYNFHVSVSRNVYTNKRYFDLLIKFCGLLFLAFQVSIPEVDKYFPNNFPGMISLYLKSVGVRGDILDHLPLDDLDDLDPNDPLSIDFSPVINSMTNSYQMIANVYAYLPKKEGVYSTDLVFNTLKSMNLGLPLQYYKLLLSWFWGKYKSARVSSRPEYTLIKPPNEVSEFYRNLVENSWVNAKAVIGLNITDTPPAIYYYKGGNGKIVYNIANRSIGIPDKHIQELYNSLHNYNATKKISSKRAHIYFNSNHEIGEALSPHGQLAHAFTHALFDSRHKRVDHTLKFNIGDTSYNIDFNQGSKIIWEAIVNCNY